ncbi:MAG: hypothetical protein WB992_13800 [Bryobacteraceae bacterium]
MILSVADGLAAGIRHVKGVRQSVCDSVNGSPAKEALDRWTEASGIEEGRLFRAINKSSKIWAIA